MLTVAALLATAVPAAADGVITEHGPLPSIPLSGVCETHFDNNGTLWVEQYLSSQVARYDTETGAFTEFDTPMPLSVPGGMALGPDGGMWMPEVTGNALLRVDTSDGGMTEYKLPWLNAFDAGPLHVGLGLSNDVVPGRDGAMWFTLGGLNAIGRFDLTTHEFSQYPVPGEILGQVQSLLGIIKSGPGNTLVMDVPQQNRVVTLDVYTHRYVSYPMPTPLSLPVGVWTDTDGTIWVTESAAMKVASINPATGAIREFPLFGVGGLVRDVVDDLLHGSVGSPLPTPGPITQGSDGNLYFLLSFPLATGLGNRIARMNPTTHQVTTWTTPSSLSSPCDLQADRPGSIWFGELVPNKIGELRIG
ncbi:Vgb family protein [Kutzneria sp. CA-103260]|uniref:Vgb family protein n=1 Tax=Kutzneria sp. CA-103260 TaxID=2802641 RepID=UPI0020127102|nr:hypothetical protein [Kutzneria sp. CA-103260]